MDVIPLCDAGLHVDVPVPGNAWLRILHRVGRAILVVGHIPTTA